MASLADRVTKPEGDEGPHDTPAPVSIPPPVNEPESTSWAEEASSAADAASATSAPKNESEKDVSDLSKAQGDGAGEPNGGAAGIVEPTYDVNIKLADLQADPNDPLYSAKTFEQLGL